MESAETEKEASLHRTSVCQEQRALSRKKYLKIGKEEGKPYGTLFLALAGHDRHGNTVRTTSKRLKFCHL